MEPAASKKSANTNCCVVLMAISVLYLLSFIDFIVEWYFLDWVIVVNGDTRNSMFWSSLGGPTWIIVFDNVVFNSSFVVSDGLLVS